MGKIYIFHICLKQLRDGGIQQFSLLNFLHSLRSCKWREGLFNFGQSPKLNNISPFLRAKRAKKFNSENCWAVLASKKLQFLEG
jgi:hypothetical protein